MAMLKFSRTNKERFMTTQTWKHLAFSLVLLGLALSTSPSLAQVGLALKHLSKRSSSSPAQAASHPAQTPETTSYTYTFLSYPGTFFTYANGINKGATTSKIGIVGGESNSNQGGFLVGVTEKKTVTEAYQAVNYPHEPLGQYATGVNDSGQIVGTYLDSSSVWHGYERTLGTFTKINAPFVGATASFASAINNSGEVVGGWNADGYTGDGASHGFTLISGTYASFDYPAAAETWGTGVNNTGEIVGTYIDTSGVFHGYLLSGSTYTSIDPPGSLQTFANGINDSGVIVGWYCTTSECVSTGDGEQGFVLSGGVFTTITIPGEPETTPTDINNNGVILGSYQDAAGVVVSFIATP
jgi:uncharacterized membrane protein